MTQEELQVRLEHYRQFVATLAATLGVPDDSMILPYAQDMAAEITRLRAELNRLDEYTMCVEIAKRDDQIARLKAELAAVPVETIRTIALTEAARLDTIDWAPIAAWFDSM